MTQFGNDVEVSDTFDRTVARTRMSLADHGFGILTEIDVAATMKAKLNQDMPAYLILGARNPYLAHTALVLRVRNDFTVVFETLVYADSRCTVGDLRR